MIFPIKVMACENTIDFLVDDEDSEEIYKYKNWIVKNGSADYRPQARVMQNSVRVLLYLEQAIFHTNKSKKFYFNNGDSLDYRKENICFYWDYTDAKNPYKIKSDIAVIQLPSTDKKQQPRYIEVDAEDINKLKDVAWSDGGEERGIIGKTLDKGQVYLDRFILNLNDAKNKVQTIDGNRFNCRKSNLRTSNDSDYVNIRKCSENTYRIENNTAYLSLTCKDKADIETMIDVEDLKRVLEFGKWSGHETTDNGKIYVVCTKKSKGSFYSNKLHRFIMNPSKEFHIDHINGNTSDNRKNNLRFINSMGNSQNVFNATSRSQSGLQNVYFLKHLPVRPYMVLLRVKDKIVHQKYFASIEDAKLDALQARKKYYEYSQEAINAN